MTSINDVQITTYGRTYDVKETELELTFYTYIVDDGYEYTAYLEDGDFITLEEWRNKKIDKLIGD